MNLATKHRTGPTGHTTHNEDTHESARQHVTGTAMYIDDLPEPAGLLHAALGLVMEGPGRLLALDLDAVRHMPGVVDLVTAKDLIHNDISPVQSHDDPILVDGTIRFVGQPVFLVVAKTRDQALDAVKLARFDVDVQPGCFNSTTALAKDSRLSPRTTWRRGNAETVLSAAPVRIKTHIRSGAQDHFYLEGQITLAVPGENDTMRAYVSTQHPSENQHMIAHVLGVAMHKVSVSTRRLGGGFGGKETQANLSATLAAVAAARMGKPVKLRLDRDVDMIATGKRHEVETHITIGTDEAGKIQGVHFDFRVDGGHSTDLTHAVADRAMLHADNCYFFPHVRMDSERLRTHKVSATAFRGFGGPQGVLASEWMIESIARRVGKDPLDVRLLNLYGAGPEDPITPYGQRVDEAATLRGLIEDLAKRSNYRKRRAAIQEEWNKRTPLTPFVRGIALTPVKFGISFTHTAFNRASALVNVYPDGSVAVHHGGIEMGQGLHSKILKVAADCFGLERSRAHIMATDTHIVPNTVATAASAGTDLNGMAVLRACETIKERLIDHAIGRFGGDKDRVIFKNGSVLLGNHSLSFAELAEDAINERIPLMAEGHYQTPGLRWDRAAGQGIPFYYFSLGAAVSEMVVDRFTGETRLVAVDILHDVGESLHPAIDQGQIEGGFMQGLGWLTSEEVVWGEDGRVLTHAPSTYKIPVLGCRPDHLKIDFWKGRNPMPTVGRSKAVGEPPLMLATSAFLAIADAISGLGGGKRLAQLEAPATPERIFFACEKMLDTS